MGREPRARDVSAILPSRADASLQEPPRGVRIDRRRQQTRQRALRHAARVGQPARHRPPPNATQPTPAAATRGVRPRPAADHRNDDGDDPATERGVARARRGALEPRALPSGWRAWVPVEFDLFVEDHTDAARLVVVLRRESSTRARLVTTSTRRDPAEVRRWLAEPRRRWDARALLRPLTTAAFVPAWEHQRHLRSMPSLELECDQSHRRSN